MRNANTQTRKKRPTGQRFVVRAIFAAAVAAFSIAGAQAATADAPGATAPPAQGTTLSFNISANRHSESSYPFCLQQNWGGKGSSYDVRCRPDGNNPPPPPPAYNPPPAPGY